MGCWESLTPLHFNWFQFQWTEVGLLFHNYHTKDWHLYFLVYVLCFRVGWRTARPGSPSTARTTGLSGCPAGTSRSRPSPTAPRGTPASPAVPGPGQASFTASWATPTTRLVIYLPNDWTEPRKQIPRNISIWLTPIITAGNVFFRDFHKRTKLKILILMYSHLFAVPFLILTINVKWDVDILRLQTLLVQSISNGTAKTMLAKLVLLYCGEFVKNSFQPGIFPTFDTNKDPKSHLGVLLLHNISDIQAIDVAVFTRIRTGVRGRNRPRPSVSITSESVPRRTAASRRTTTASCRPQTTPPGSSPTTKQGTVLLPPNL